MERLGVPAFLGGMSRGLLGKDHRLMVRQNRSAALKKSDLVILVGAVVDFRLGYGKALPGPSRAKIVSVNRSEEHLQLNQGYLAALSGGGWTAAVGSIGDPCDFMVRAAQQFTSDGCFD